MPGRQPTWHCCRRGRQQPCQLRKGRVERGQQGLQAELGPRETKQRRGAWETLASSHMIFVVNVATCAAHESWLYCGFIIVSCHFSVILQNTTKQSAIQMTENEMRRRMEKYIHPLKAKAGDIAYSLQRGRITWNICWKEHSCSSMFCLPGCGAQSHYCGLTESFELFGSFLLATSSFLSDHMEQRKFNLRNWWENTHSNKLGTTEACVCVEQHLGCQMLRMMMEWHSNVQCVFRVCCVCWMCDIDMWECVSLSVYNRCTFWSCLTYFGIIMVLRPTSSLPLPLMRFCF